LICLSFYTLDIDVLALKGDGCMGYYIYGLVFSILGMTDPCYIYWPGL